jgi:hypothetical protein
MSTLLLVSHCACDNLWRGHNTIYLKRSCYWAGPSLWWQPDARNVIMMMKREPVTACLEPPCIVIVTKGSFNFSRSRYYIVVLFKKPRVLLHVDMNETPCIVVVSCDLKWCAIFSMLYIHLGSVGGATFKVLNIWVPLLSSWHDH